MTKHSLNPLPNQTLAYSDGACRGNGVADNAKGGFGTVIILPNGEQFDICGGEQATTNNRMELMGAIMALEHSPPQLPIQIWSDSSYVIKGITEWIAGWKKKNWKNVKNTDLWQRLDKACQNRTIDWQWVKGHAGHDGNEYADQLANQGIDNLPKTFEKRQFEKQIINPQDLKLELIKKDNPMTNLPNAINDIEHINQQADFESDFSQDYDTDNYHEGDVYDDAFLSALDEMPVARANVSESPIGVDFSHFIDSNGNFIAQDESLQAQRPDFDGITSQPNTSFVPLLPIAKNQGVGNRQLILDTETTGFDAQNGDRIIEVGIVEVINRRFTGEKLHVYLNPHKMMDEEVIKVHGIHNVFLDGMPTFEQVGQALYDFLQGAEIVAHNAGFDINFLQAEFERMGINNFSQSVTVTDSLAIAKQMYAGQRNTLDALVKRLNVGKQDRTFHGALLDAEILAEVYLTMTGGQVSLAIDDVAGGGINGAGEHLRFDTPVIRFLADTQAQEAHLSWLNSLAKKHPQLASNWGVEAAEPAQD